jgi:RNA polymerase sigma-70 factor (ECF subfamily)
MTEEAGYTLEAVRRRDPAAVTALVAEHQRRLRGFVAFLCGRDLQAIDDLAQEVFLRALKILERVTDLEHFDRFLREIARNVIREYRRREGARPEADERLIDAFAAAYETDPAPETHLLARLRHCLRKLPERSARILALRYNEERAAEEIGSEIGLKAGAVRVLLLRIRENLLKCISSASGLDAVETNS